MQGRFDHGCRNHSKTREGKIRGGGRTGDQRRQCLLWGVAGVDEDRSYTSNLYSEEERGGVPADAVAASLGCGNPTALARRGVSRFASRREASAVRHRGEGSGAE